MVRRALDPLNWETPLEALTAGPTALDAFFVRSRNPRPAPPEALELGPRRWTWAELQGRPHQEALITLECAGNGRTLAPPVVPGVAWGLGGVSTAWFTGTSLGALLREVGVPAGAVEVLFEGADPGFARSLPLGEALRPEVLLAWAMNGEPLRPEHGAPLRLVVPGWYGMASVKWLRRISFLSRPFHGPLQGESYVYLGQPGVPEGTPVTRVRVRSLLTRVTPARLEGLAWSGGGAIERVLFTLDGRSWSPARLQPPASPWSAAAWSAEVSLDPEAPLALGARAWDASGASQPLAPVWNRQGYGNHGVMWLVGSLSSGLRPGPPPHGAEG